MDPATLVAYFAKRDEARKAFRELARQDFRRAVQVHKAANGEVRIRDALLWRRASGVTLAAIFFGGLAGVVSLFLHRWGLLPDGNLLPLSLVLTAATGGALAAFFWLRRFRYGVEPGVVADHARWLMPGESVLLLQGSSDSLPGPVAMLRESGDVAPALFVMHPRRERRAGARTSEVKLSPAQVLEHAQRHAREQQVDPGPQRGTELLKRFRQSRQWIRRICAELAAASRLEQKTTSTADWILDNEYILDGNARAVLLNMPRRFYQQLPILASDPYRGLPCIYGLAKDLVSHTELRLDRENILAYIEAYQLERTLTIGELWALPQMLRIALIESIQSLAITALADLRERQLADFWANRLISANRRDSNQLFRILSELAKAEPHPSPYFGAQLVSLLYDEAVVLAPVKNWLERMLKTILPDLHRRELNRQTREQLASGNAFTSLRQLAQLDWREIFENLSRVEQELRRDPSGVYPQMDFATRDRCRQAIEELARAAAQPEKQVAARAIQQAALVEPEATVDERRRHVGTWLIGKGRVELARQLACREALRHRILAW
ncbi:MAG: hypothetical protein LC633_09670, partial [Desulfobulbaceae bacterium]|nr:hypothetical protein [Desulfobulbaceae bacterium]